MTHEGFKLVTPPDGVHALTERLTAECDLFLVTHMGLAAIEPETWWLDIDGLVDRPARLTLADLAGLPTVAVTAVHECAGSPLTPTEPKRRVGNVTWSGVPLRRCWRRPACARTHRSSGRRGSNGAASPG
jgi:DMSO/TMAO reductase YedYZ molybdopterin-dependent catalytic subunit